MAQTRVGIRAPSIFNGLLAYYRADGTTNDQLGNYNGTLVNGATYGVGKIGQGFSFDGINDYISFNAPPHNYSTPTSYNLWVKPDIVSGTKFFIYIPMGISGPAIGYRNGGTITLFRGSVNLEVQSISKVAVGVWNMITVVFKGNAVANNVDFYLNGVYSDTKTLGFGNTVPSTMEMGRSNSSGLYYDGTLDEIGIWNKLLTPSEITQLYNEGNGKQK